MRNLFLFHACLLFIFIIRNYLLLLNHLLVIILIFQLWKQSLLRHDIFYVWLFFLSYIFFSIFLKIYFIFFHNFFEMWCCIFFHCFCWTPKNQTQCVSFFHCEHCSKFIIKHWTNLFFKQTLLNRNIYIIQW